MFYRGTRGMQLVVIDYLGHVVVTHFLVVSQVGYQNNCDECVWEDG